jgi:hypothetical protein
VSQRKKKVWLRGSRSPDMAPQQTLVTKNETCEHGSSTLKVPTSIISTAKLSPTVPETIRSILHIRHLVLLHATALW